MKSQNPSHNVEVFKDDKEDISFLKELCTTKCAPSHTLRNQILADVNKVLTHSLKNPARFIYTLPSNHQFHWPDFIFFRYKILTRTAATYGPPSTRSKWLVSSFFFAEKNI